MGKNKNKCWACGDKHYPPTGKNCKNAQKPSHETVMSGTSDDSLDERDSLSSQAKSSVKNKKSAKYSSVAGKKDFGVKSQYGQSDTAGEMGLVDEAAGQWVQFQILAELRSMAARLETVEEQMGQQKSVTKVKTKTHKLSSSAKLKKSVNQSDTSSSESNESLESSDDEVKLPGLSHIRSSKEVQRQIDRSIAKLSRKQLEGNENSQKLKSKRGVP